MKKLLKTRTTNTLIAACAAAMLLYFLLFHSDTNTLPTLSNGQTNADTTQPPNIYLSNTISQQYNEQGLIDSIIRSDAINYYPNNENAITIRPRITIFQQGINAWQVEAETGILEKNGEQLTLKNNIIINNTDKTTTLTTEQLTALPQQKILHTENAIVMTQPSGTTNAVGLHADLASEEITLLNNVKGQYHAAP
jgi:LPS export ABC transporter protein LptC